MASLEFEIEKKEFRIFYNDNLSLLNEAKDLFVSLIRSLVTHDSTVGFVKIEGRIKDREESIKKFSRKYRSRLEESKNPYEIKNHITDLIGLRIVCLYEDDINKLSSLINDNFIITEITDKISELENTEASFGYKGLHLDLKTNSIRNELPEYQPYSNFNFELQIRTIIQDSWSVLDHKIKYKKSIPNELKRRINVLSALFELADREFREIRDLTQEEIDNAEEIDNIEVETDNNTNKKTLDEDDNINNGNLLNAFSFLKIGNHFFSDYEFEPYKVDGFVQTVQDFSSGITRSRFHNLINKNISTVKTYMEKLGVTDINPFTVFRHCLYLGEQNVFERLLTNSEREMFNEHHKKKPNKRNNKKPAK